MNRPLIIGILGGVIVVAAISLAFLIDREPTEPSVVRSSSPDTPGVVAGKSVDGAKKAPGLAAPAVVDHPIRPSFDVVRVNPRGDAVIAGRAEPNAEVTIREGKIEIGRVTADSRGEWVLVPREPLAAGSRELSLSARKAQGPVELSDQNVVIVVPERGKDIAGRSVDKPSGSLAILVPREGAGPSTVLQRPSTNTSASALSADGRAKSGAASGGRARSGAASGGRSPMLSAGEQAASKLALDAVDYDSSGKLSLSGKAPAGAQVQIYLDNRLVGMTKAGKAGGWQISPDKPVEAGLYTMRVDQVAEGGKVVARIETKFSRAKPLGNLPRDAFVFVQPGNNLWRIARRSYGSGVRYSVIYEANREQIRDPSLIYPGQVFVVPQVN